MPSPVTPTIQPSFAAGELSPALYGRIDYNKYHVGLRTARNVTVMPQGGLRNRAGTLFVAQAKDSTHKVRVVRFTVSTSLSYVLEFGHQYIRFYLSDLQVGVGSPAAWSNATAYVPGNIVSSGGTNYYCILANTNQAPPNGTYWYALTGAIMEIPTPYQSDDLFDIKIAQSADVMYITQSNYAQRTLTFNAVSQWVLAVYPNTNGPFMPRNSDMTSTITPSALTGSITLTATKNLFFSGHVGSLWQLVSIVFGQTTNPVLTSATTNWIPTNSTWQAVTTGTWSGTILVQTSPDNITWTTVSTVTSNGTVSGSTGFTNGYMRAIMQSALPFSGSASVALTGNGNVTTATTLHLLNAATVAVPAGDTAKITLTNLSGSGDTVLLQRSDDAGVTWNTLATYTTNQAGVSVATTKTACLIRAQKTIDGGGSPVATVDGTTGAAPTLTVVISSASVSAAIQCGPNWAVVTTGSWTGKILLQISTDGGNNWQLIQTISAGNNVNTSGQTGVSQCLLRAVTDGSVAWTGSATVDLTSETFNWTGVVLITAYTSATQVTGTVQALSNTNNSGLANTSSTWEWSEGSWSAYRGFPDAVSFYQDRLGFGGTPNSEPNTEWLTVVGNYTDFSISSPLQDSDSISIVLPGRQLNRIESMVVLLNTLISLTSDSEYAVAPSTGTGSITPSTVDQTLQGRRGSANIDPVVVGQEIITIQQMGTVVRNLMFQLAVNGYFGDNISINSQHLFTGFSIVEMAYQQEPDSIIWMVRSDGQLISTTYIREQDINAFTHHDTNGLFESVTCIPNSTLGINEVWFVVNRNGTRFIEAMKPRDQSLTDVTKQWFVDCGSIYSGAPATVISGLTQFADGTAVSVLADGFVVPNLTVTGGTITLKVAASTVIIGLGYTSDVETLPGEIMASGAWGGKTMQGRRVSIPRAVFRMINSLGCYAMGTNQNLFAPASGVAGMTPIIKRNPTDATFNQAMPLQTEDDLINLNGGYDKQPRVFMRQVDPIPFTLLSILPEIVISER